MGIGFDRTVSRAIQRYRQFWLWGRGIAAGPEFRLPLMPWSMATGPVAQGEPMLVLPGERHEPKKATFYGRLQPPGERLLIRAPEMRPFTISRHRDILALPHHVVLSRRQGKLLPATFDLASVLGDHVLTRVDEAKYDYVLWRRMPMPIAIEEPAFFADSMFRGYGHSLLEVLPKLHLLERMPDGIRVATSALILKEAFEFFGVPANRIITINRPTLFRTLYVPDPPVTLAGHFDPLGREAFARLGSMAERSSLEPKPRLFLSRSRVPRRRPDARAQIEALFVRHGFAVIHPETLPMADQIRLVAGAEMIAGETGSAMHTLVFARPETRALFIGPRAWLSLADQAIARADGQFGFVLGEGPDGEDARDADWTVDPAEVEEALVAHFGLAREASAG